MSEEEIIKYIKDEIENEIDTFHWFDDTQNNSTRKQIEESIKAHQGLLDLYNEEKEKNNTLLVELASNNYISKDKIKAKIEELEKRKKDLLEMEESCARTIGIEDCDEKIILYNELLEE